MARLLGRYRSGGCGCKIPGPDCAGHGRDTRWRKRVEAREVAAIVAEYLDGFAYPAVPEGALERWRQAAREGR